MDGWIHGWMDRWMSGCLWIHAWKLEKKHFPPLLLYFYYYTFTLLGLKELHKVASQQVSCSLQNVDNDLPCGNNWDISRT